MLNVFKLFGILLTPLLLLLSLGACAPKTAPSSIEVQTQSLATSVPTQVPATATALPNVSVAPVATPQDIAAGVQAVTAALQGANAKKLSPLLLDEVYLAQGPNGETGESMSRDDALQWLNKRWGNRHRVVSQQYVEHFVLLEITTDGWARLAPIQSGILAFHLHRYNAQGGQDPLRGDWRIDSLLYE